MENADKGTKYARIAAILFAVVALYYLAVFLRDIKIASFKEITEWVLLSALSIAFFLKNKIILVCSAVANAALYIWWIIPELSFCSAFSSLSLAWLIIISAKIAMVAISVLALKQSPYTKNLWFLMGTLLATGYAFYFSLSDLTLSNYIYTLLFKHSWHWEFSNIAPLARTIESAALFLGGLWLSGTADLMIPAASSVESYKQSRTSSEIIGTADALKTYHELLACGAITQSEFDAKKKDIMGL